MIKTIKGKVIAGTVAVTLFAGAGVAFGASDAGTNLKAWYDGQFKQASADVGVQVATYAGSKVDGLTKEYNGLKTEATNSINKQGEFVTGVAQDNIDEKSREHIDAIKDQKKHIEGYLATQFDSLSTFTNGLIEQAGKDALDYANRDLTAHTGAAGKVAIDKMNTDVKATTAQAVKDLKETIDWAKTDLQAQLDKESDLTVEEIKGLIDAKIIELRKEVTIKRNALVKEQERIITMTAKGLQLAAEAEMEAIVRGIIK